MKILILLILTSNQQLFSLYSTVKKNVRCQRIFLLHVHLIELMNVPVSMSHLLERKRDFKTDFRINHQITRVSMKL